MLLTIAASGSCMIWTYGAQQGFLFHSVLASMIMIRASMAGTTLAHRYSKSDEPVRPSVLLVVILLSTILLLTRNWIFLSIELNLLWLSDDLLSWKRLSHHPGSWFAGLSSAPIVWHIWRGDFYEWLEQWHRKQGSIVRIGPNRLSTSDANLIRQLDNKKFGSPRSGWYGAAIDPNPFHEPNVTTLTDMAHHEHRRKKMTPAYNEFRMMESLRCSVENHLAKVLDEHIDRADEGVAEVDLAQISEQFSIQAFSNMAFGQDLTESDVRAISRTVSDGQLGFMMMTMFPWIQVCVGGLSAFLKLDQRLAFGRTLATVKKVVASRFAENMLAPPMIGTLLKHRHADIVSGLQVSEFDVGQVADNLNVQMIASSAVTAPAIALLGAKFLLQSKSTRNRIKQEFAREFVELPKRKEYPYFSALRDESLRLCPPALHFREKLTLPEGYPTYRIPGGTHIGICLGATMRDAEIFGVNPDEYDPSRWMTSHGRGGTQQGCLEDMLKALELNFGSGTSKCLGQKVALLELAIFLSKMTEYEWEPTGSLAEFGAIVRRGVLRVGSLPVKVRRRKVETTLGSLVQDLPVSRT